MDIFFAGSLCAEANYIAEYRVSVDDGKTRNELAGKEQAFLNVVLHNPDGRFCIS